MRPLQLQLQKLIVAFNLAFVIQGFAPGIAAVQRQTRTWCENSASIDRNETKHEELVRSLWEKSPFESCNLAVRTILEGRSTTPLFITSSQESIPEPFLRFYQNRGFHPCDVNNDLTHPPSKRKRRKKSFRLDLAYNGSAFAGWQRQEPGIKTVQGTVEDALHTFLNLSKSSTMDVRVSGRTDAGVHAVGQVGRFRTERNVNSSEVMDFLESFSDGTWKCWRVTPASDSFHPIFGSSSRSYVYIIDSDCLFDENSSESVENLVTKVNNLLEPLRGQVYNFIACSYGKLKTQTADCCLSHAIAREITSSSGRSCLSIELTGNRFLRRMVRILVSTTLQLSFSDGTLDLVSLLQSEDRRIAARPAPPGGLIFVGATIPDSQSLENTVD